MAEHWAAEDEQEKVKSEALKIIDLFQNLPRLVVFDIDYTLWPFFCECYDKDHIPWLYPQARGIIYALKDKGIEMAIASRSPTSDVAKAFLAKLGIQSMFTVQEIFSSWTHKTEHFQRIHTRTGIPFDSMLFFDDEHRNIEAVSKMGVTCVWVDRGGEPRGTEARAHTFLSEIPFLSLQKLSIHILITNFFANIYSVISVI